MTAPGLRRGWCPSLLRPMESGDGWLVRLRPRHAVFTAATARAVAAASAAYGNGLIEITNRANLQIRGLAAETIAPFTAAMEAAGAADIPGDGPMVLVSPLAGADPGLAAETLGVARGVASLVAPTSVTRGLDPRAYPYRRPDGVAAPEWVDARVKPAHDERETPAHDESEGPAQPEFPPKFGFLVDGGGALPLTGISLDVTLRATGSQWHLNGEPVPSDEAASRAIALARSLANAQRQVPSRIGDAPPLGFHPYGDGESGAVLLAPAFGQILAPQLANLAALAERHGDGRLRPTPWKSLAIAGVTRARAALVQAEAETIGLIADPADPRLGIVTCAGAPACRRGEVETHVAATALAVMRGSGTGSGTPLWHLSGCAKGCAHPGPAAVTLVGEGGRFALIRHGRPGDEPAARNLTLAEIAALMQSVPA
jgi:precorrin-3B synthase